MSKEQIIKIIISVLIAGLTALGAAFGLSSCNVTRTITTKSEYWQKADTSVVIQTKTIETYDDSCDCAPNDAAELLNDGVKSKTATRRKRNRKRPKTFF